MPPTKPSFKNCNRIIVAAPDLLLESRLPNDIRIYSNNKIVI